MARRAPTCQGGPRRHDEKGSGHAREPGSAEVI